MVERISFNSLGKLLILALLGSYFFLSCSHQESADLQEENRLMFIMDSLNHRIGRTESFEQSLQSIRDAVAKNGSQRLKARLMALESNVHIMQSNFNEARTFIDQAISGAYSAKDTSVLIESYSLSATIYRRIGSNQEAVDEYFRAIELSDEADMPHKKGVLYHNLALVYFGIKDIEGSIKFMKLALEFKSKSMNSESNLASTYNSLGNAYKRLGEKDSAMYYYEQALDYFELEGNQFALASVESNMGLFLTEQSDFEKAEYYFDRAINRMRSLGPNPNYVNVLTAMSTLLIKLDRIDETFELLREAEEINANINNKATELNILLKQYEAYKALGKKYNSYEYAEKAIDYLDVAYDLNDSLYSDDLAQAIKENEVRFETAEKEQALLLKGLKIEQQRLYLSLFMGLVTILLLVVTLLIWMFRKQKLLNQTVAKQAEELELKASELEQKNKELASLNMMKTKLFSVISHDIRTPIHGLKGSMSLIKDSNAHRAMDEDLWYKLERSVLSATDMIQKLLQWSKVQLSGFSIHPKTIEVYDYVFEACAPLESTLRDKQLTLDIQGDKNLQFFTDPDVLRVVVYNLVQNAIKFSFPGSPIEIHFGVEENESLYLRVKDFGKGMSEKVRSDLRNHLTLVSEYGTANEKGSGLGLMLCREFLQMLNADIRFESEEGEGTTFDISIPALVASSTMVE